MSLEQDTERASLLDSVHYTVSKACRRAEEEAQVSISRGFVHCLSQLVFEVAHRMGEDLESFARHARRSTVQVEDVLLCARRNPSLVEVLSEFVEENKGKGKERGKRAKVAEENAVLLVDSEESDEDLVL
jgi:centromere protein S